MRALLGLAICVVLVLAATHRVNGLWSLRSPAEEAGRWVLAPGAVIQPSAAVCLRVTRLPSSDHARTASTGPASTDRSAPRWRLGHAVVVWSLASPWSVLLAAVPATRGPPAVPVS